MCNLYLDPMIPNDIQTFIKMFNDFPCHMSPPKKISGFFRIFLNSKWFGFAFRAGGGAAAGGHIGETVFATSNTLLEKLPAPWWQ